MFFYRVFRFVQQPCLSDRFKRGYGLFLPTLFDVETVISVLKHVFLYTGRVCHIRVVKDNIDILVDNKLSVTVRKRSFLKIGGHFFLIS